jgi:SAM-dependent methyltransferase
MTGGTLVCRICGSDAIGGMPFGYRFRDKWLGAVRCRDCGIIFLDPQPTDDDFRAMYAREYFEGDFRCGHEGSYFDDATLQKLSDDSMVKRIQSYKPSGRLLEIGCAGGVFLDLARRAGFRVRGVEFSADAAQFARDKFALDVHTGDLASARFADDSFDVIFMGDVLEHIPDPRSTIAEIRRVLAPGGLLVVLCPMQTNTIYSRTGFFAYRLLRRKATVNLPPYHVFEYRVRSMKRLVEGAGLRVQRVFESTIRPSEIAMRNSPLQNFLKKIFQYPNYYITRLCNRFGDRIELFAVKGDSAKK